MRILILSFFVLISLPVFSQLTPPGLGSNSKINGWFAVGINQKLDSAGRFISMTYFGIDGQSALSRYNVFDRVGIFVINEEVKFKMKRNFNTSLALSYRHQNVFESNLTDLDVNHFKQEFRIYGRIGKSWKKSWIPGITLRQEWRKFYTPQFELWDISSAFRTRLKFQSEINLTASKQLKAILGAEILFTTEFMESDKNWESFNYSETRFSAFLSYSTKSKIITYNLGMMDDVLESEHRTKSIPYLSFVVVFNNLLGSRI